MGLLLLILVEEFTLCRDVINHHFVSSTGPLGWTHDKTTVIGENFRQLICGNILQIRQAIYPTRDDVQQIVQHRRRYLGYQQDDECIGI